MAAFSCGPRRRGRDPAAKSHAALIRSASVLAARLSAQRLEPLPPTCALEVCARPTHPARELGGPPDWQFVRRLQTRRCLSLSDSCKPVALIACPLRQKRYGRRFCRIEAAPLVTSGLLGPNREGMNERASSRDNSSLRDQ